MNVGPTNRLTDRPTDRVTYRVACTRLKIRNSLAGLEQNLLFLGPPHITWNLMLVELFKSHIQMTAQRFTSRSLKRKLRNLNDGPRQWLFRRILKRRYYTVCADRKGRHSETMGKKTRVTRSCIWNKFHDLWKKKRWRGESNKFVHTKGKDSEELSLEKFLGREKSKMDGQKSKLADNGRKMRRQRKTTIVGNRQTRD